MRNRAPSERVARTPATIWGIVAIAIVVGFVMFVVRRGLTGQAVATWMAASAAGIVVFLVAGAVRRRRGK